MPWCWPPTTPYASGIVLPDGTVLTFGAIADGQLLQRDGNEIIGVDGARALITPNGTVREIQNLALGDLLQADTAGTDLIGVAGARALLQSDNTVSPIATIAVNEYLQIAGDGRVDGASISAGATLIDQFFVQLDAAFTTTDTTSPGTVCISQVVDVPANAWIVIVSSFSLVQTGTTGTPRAELLVDGALINSNTKGASGTVSTTGFCQAAALQFAGDTASLGGAGNRTIALAFYTAGTGTIGIDPAVASQHADLSILVFVG